jgi:recombination protein RecA
MIQLDMTLDLQKLAKAHKQTAFTFASSPHTVCDFIPTGIATLDDTFGGIPIGRFTQLYGDFSTLKTTIALLTCANALRMFPDKQVVYCDFEYSLNPEYAAMAGIDVNDERFNIIQPDSPELAVTILKEAIVTGEVSVVVYDSVYAAQPLSVTDGSVEAAHIGAHARLMGKVCAQLKPLVSKYDVAMIFINQVRVDMNSYGSGEIVTGGRALGFYSDLTIRLGKSQLKKGDVVIGHTINAKAMKSKVSKPFAKTEFDFFFESGIDFCGALIRVAIDKGVVVQGGSWLTWGDFKVQGIQNMSQELMSEPGLFEKLKSEVYN